MLGFPGTSSFLSEFFIIISLFYNNIFLGIFSFLSMIFSTIYSFWLLGRIFNGFFFFNKLPIDLTNKEFLILNFLIIPSYFLGIFPNIIIEKLEIFNKFLIEFN